MTNLLCRTIDSPVGPLTLAGDGAAVSHLRMTNQSHPPAGRSDWRRDDTVFTDAVAQLDEYFAGDRTTFELTLEVTGTAFQRDVWRALSDIPFGETRNYGEIARVVGRPGAARAVGIANGRNPVGIIVPCHRVIGANGSLVGYGGGLDRKVQLLDLERRYALAAQ
jgi:methylated-DNA-[protein]-cysteine S-methyltransferase